MTDTSTRGRARTVLIFKFTLLTVLFLALAAPGRADTVYLKSGRQMSGVIENQASDDQRLALRSSGALIYVKREMIDRIDRRPASEAEGDAALARGDLDAALESFKTALAQIPDDPQLRHKTEDVKRQLTERDRKRYGARFDAIDKALGRGDFSRALQQARDLDKQVSEPSAHQRAQSLMSRACIGLAQQARSRYSMQEAEEFYKQAIRMAPQYAPAYLELAKVYDQQANKRAAAIILYQQALELVRGQSDQSAAVLAVRFRLGQLQLEQGKMDESIKYLIEIVRQNQIAAYPQSVDFIIQAVTKLYAESGTARIPELSGYLRDIVQHKPDETRALALLGRMDFESGRIDQSKAIFERVLALTGNNISQPPRQDAGYYLGMIARRSGDLNRAVALLDPIANSQTGNYNALCELGEIKLDQALYAQALERFKMARLLHADRFRASLGMGQALVYLKQYDEGREYLNEVLARDPKNIKALTSLAQSYFDEKKFAEVLDAAGKVVLIVEAEAGSKPKPEQVANLVYLHTMLGTANLRLNQVFMAHSHYDKALKLKPDHAPAYNGNGETCQLETKYADAEQWFQKAMAADPKNPQYPLNMALNWQKYRQNPKKALPYYKKYYELGGHDPAVRQWYIEAGGDSE